MEVEIINVKTDKNQYLFLDDKNIEFSFDIFYKDSNNNIDIIYIKYGYNIYKNNKFISKIEDKIDLYNNNDGIENLKSNFSCMIPIFLPNTDNIENFNSLNGVKIEKFIEIVVEQKSSSILKKKTKFNKIIYPNISHSNTIDVEKNVLNGDIPLKVFFNTIDYVSKDFFNYLLKKYFIFRLFNFFSIKIILFLVILVILFIVYFYIDYNYFNNLDKIINLINYNNLVKNNDLLVFIILSPLILYFFKLLPLLKLKNNIVGIKFNKGNNIIKKIESGEFIFEDLFNEFKINYDGYYNCDFSCNLDIYFILYVENKFQSNKRGNRYKSYKEKIATFELGSYKGTNIDLNKIIKSDLISKINNLNIEKLNFKNIKSGLFSKNSYIDISYKIAYNFNSSDILNNDSEITLKSYIK